MKFWNYIFLFLLGFVVTYTVAGFQNSPGYMDADYYFAGGLRLAEGEGFTEMTLWNFLDDPEGLPHPSHAYWMPVSSIIAFFGIKFFPLLPEFTGAQMISILVFGMVPPLTAALAYLFTSTRRDAIFAGLLASFSGFYLPFLSTTDTFGLYMLMGASFFLIVNRIWKEGNVWNYLVLGMLAGIMHLTRADGVIWLLIAWVVASTSKTKKDNKADDEQRLKILIKNQNRIRVTNILIILFGYIIVMSPWFVRNMEVFGVPLSPGGIKSLWLIEYNDLFAYPSSILNLSHWWQSGLGEIIKVRVFSFGLNMQTFVAVQGSIFLFPLILAGYWKFRHNQLVRLTVGSWMMILIIMTLIFPFSGAAVQPVFWALVPVGLNQFVSLGVSKRNWLKSQATIFFRVGLVLFAIGLSSLIFYQKLLVRSQNGNIWDETSAKYAELDEILISHNASPGDIILVINPPGYYLATGRTSIAIPNGDINTLLALALRYHADYLILESDFPLGLQSLHDDFEDQNGLIFLGEFDNTKLFEIDINGQLSFEVLRPTNAPNTIQ